ncbi:hypothetical protein C1H46_019077 [Malus baccata]|uniref:Uncharacterized protein n=1 Tax=Malus baccata TaxID=106549 RepID=A0A540M978_MALBA|nr:hypothetical protein C1H46_019077 [Malus baccata]
MQGFGATELLMNSHENDDLRSAKIEQASKVILCYNFESPDRASAFLYGELGKTPLEFIFHHKKHECMTYAKRFAEASKLILLYYNVESPDRASAFLDGELGETPLESAFQDTKPEGLNHAKRFMAASKLILLRGERATPLVDEFSKSASQTAVLLKK